jgi:hypothetical protein
MRKSVKLAAASALAAVALAGGSATAASANDRNDEPGFNACANDDSKLASAHDNGEVETDEIETTGKTTQTACQVGKKNEANLNNETEVDGEYSFLGDITGDILGGVTVGA